MSLTKLRRELAFAINMANMGRDPAWLPVIEKLDNQIKTKQG